ncbi:MAG: hypothetical protein JWN43_2342 [Gammaproteobacteria bacterium]|nr:hypothetical protein [Gammaproteobacteria bacterium]
MSAVVQQAPLAVCDAAFDDPTSHPNAPPRRSIEVRAIVFW